MDGIPVEGNEISPPEACEELTPDEEHFQEATGNAGASFERTYRRAALVVWPAHTGFAVLAQGGLPVTLPMLQGLVQRTSAGGDEAARRQALDLGGQIIRQWPVDEWYRQRSDSESDTGRMSRLLAQLDDHAAISAFMRKAVAAGQYGKADCEAIAEALARLPADEVQACAADILSADGARRYGHCAHLLAALATLPAIDPSQALRQAADTLTSLLPRAYPGPGYRNPDPVDSKLVFDVLASLARIDASLADRAAAHMIAWPATYDLDRVLLPAARRLVALHPGIAKPHAVALLRDVCVLSLEARIAEDLEPPRDLRRPSHVSCRCERCAELSRFLDNPAAMTWVLRAAAPIRSHVEGTIGTSGCDVDTRTERKGSPHSLICTKNNRSYDRRVAQRAQDIADLALVTR